VTNYVRGWSLVVPVALWVVCVLGGKNVASVKGSRAVNRICTSRLGVRCKMVRRSDATASLLG
jgi:hypothetical protein